MLATLETLGGNISCSSTREALMYQAGVFHHHIPLAVRVLASTVNEPRFDEMQQVVDSIQYENEQLQSKPETLVPELLHQVAWNHKGLGNPILCSMDALQQLTMSKISAYHDKMYVPSNMVVAGAGVDHEELVQLTQEHFGHLKDSPAQDKHATTEYTGGHAMVEDHSQEFTHIHIGFRGLGIASQDLYALATLQMLLGGGGSFSSGGPGKGMYSRIYTRVLNRQWWVEQCNAFNFVYSDDGLFGVASACRPEYAARMVQVMCDELASVCEMGHVTPVELARARNQLKSSLLMNLESRMVQLEDIGRQVQVLNQRISTQEMNERIDAVDERALVHIARKILQSGKAPASIVSYGPLHALGNVERTLNRYGFTI